MKQKCLGVAINGTGMEWWKSLSIIAVLDRRYIYSMGPMHLNVWNQQQTFPQEEKKHSNG
jgi:hypothetical protein